MPSASRTCPLGAATNPRVASANDVETVRSYAAATAAFDAAVAGEAALFAVIGGAGLLRAGEDGTAGGPDGGLGDAQGLRNG